VQFAARTEFLRLAAGELVYMGLLQNRLDVILPSASVRGQIRVPSPGVVLENINA